MKKDIPIPPLKNLQFFLYGKLKDKEETKKRVLKLGGLVVSKLTDTTVAVISTKKEIERMPDKMEEIKSKDIEVMFIYNFISKTQQCPSNINCSSFSQVVEESYLDLIEPNGTVAKSLELIKENNIADWGSDVSLKFNQSLCTSLLNVLVKWYLMSTASFKASSRCFRWKVYS